MQSTVAISANFLDAYARLPRKVQQKASALISKMRADLDSPGINYERINCADEKLYSVRVDDTYRGIVARQQENNTCLLLWVDHHDKAYAWAKRKKCTVNAVTGAIQVYETIEEPAAEVLRDATPKLFDGVSDRQLIALGLPEDVIPLVRTVTNISEFEQALEKLPFDCVEGLSWIANGFPYEEVIELLSSEVELNQKGNEQGFAKALSNPVTCKSFVIIEGEDELQKILAAPLEKWRVFLHPSQRKIVNKDFNGSARVLGSAGTGKTVVAMHRAKHLAQYCNEGERILFTTFSSNLAADIQGNLKKICNSKELRNIDVINLDAWVASFLHKSGLSHAIEYNQNILNEIWEKAIVDVGCNLPFEPSFYADEWSQVILAQESIDLASYVHAKRTGRGVRLVRRERIAVWDVVEAYRQLCKERGIRDVDAGIYEAAQLLHQDKGEGQYRYILVDEGQDFSTVAYRLVRALAGSEKPNDIFIVGDSRQRIYRKAAVLSRCGINIRGRASVLRINYRTTQENHSRAMAVLEGLSFDDLDGNEEIDNVVQSLMRGPKPLIQPCKDANAEIKFIVEHIEALIASGVSDKDICVTMRTNDTLKTYADAFMKKGLRVYKLKPRKIDDRGIDGVRFATMHRIKGLEFDYVFAADVSQGTMPARFLAQRANEEGNLDQVIKTERSLLYVSMTRAKKQVFVTSAGKMSEIVDADVE